MNKIYDAIVIGGGPAGLSAAIYLARAKFSVLVIERETFGGQITITAEVVNYPGVFKTSGKRLTEEMQEQAKAFGASFLLADVKSVDLSSDVKKIVTDKGAYEAVGVIIATGSHPRKLGFKGEREYQGRGVAYCATCDGEFFTGKDIFVIGGGFAAAEEAIFLTKYGKSVTVVVRGDDFTCAKSIADKVKENPKIEVWYNTEIKEALGDEKLRRAVFISKDGSERIYETKDTFGIFVFAGYEPATDVFKDVISLNEAGNIITDMNMRTNLAGVYAAGDVCVKNLRQVVTAVSDGATASTSLEKYIPEVIKKLGLNTVKLTVDSKPKVEEKEENENTGGFLSSDIKRQLEPIIKTVNKPLELRVIDNGSALAKEMMGFVSEFKDLSSFFSATSEAGDIPGIKFYSEGKYLNINFHAIPGGHEFNSFVIAVFNAVGRKQPIDSNLKSEIEGLGKTNIKVFVSLSCTMCPEVVMASQRIALLNPNVEAEVYDLQKFPEIKDKYDIMSVPAMLINDSKLSFGKKSIDTIIEMLK